MQYWWRNVPPHVAKYVWGTILLKINISVRRNVPLAVTILMEERSSPCCFILCLWGTILLKINIFYMTWNKEIKCKRKEPNSEHVYMICIPDICSIYWNGRHLFKIWKISHKQSAKNNIGLLMHYLIYTWYLIWSIISIYPTHSLAVYQSTCISVW